MNNKEINNHFEALLRMMEIQAQTNEEVFARIRSLEAAMAGFVEDDNGGNGDFDQNEAEREARQTMEDMSIPHSKR